MKLHWLGWLVVVLACLEGGWFLYDGIHALTTGDYVTPSTGQYAGQLGPWSKLWLSVGIEPRSTFVQLVHVGLGAVSIISIVAFILRARWGWRAMLICAIAGIWYLPNGTLLSVLQIALLSTPTLRK